MKNFLNIFLGAALLTALLASCENTVEVIYTDGNEPVLVMNAMLEQGDSLHYVYVCLSEGSDVKAVTEAEVKCSVNGGSPVTAQSTVAPDAGYYSGLRTCAYVFTARFNPGDELKLTAAYRGMEVTATVAVPLLEGVISSVDTATVTVYRNKGTDSEYTKEFRQYRVHLKDAQADISYYRLYAEQCFWRVDSLGVEGYMGSSGYQLDGTDDYLLNPNIGRGDYEDDLFFSSVNTYNVFTDETFSGGACTLTLLESSSGVRYPDGGYTFDWTPKDKIRYLVRLKLLNISREEYLYISAQTGDDDGGGIITEPIVYPENVGGGLGLVTVSTPSVYEIDLPDLPSFVRVLY